MMTSYPYRYFYLTAVTFCSLQWSTVKAQTFDVPYAEEHNRLQIALLRNYSKLKRPTKSLSHPTFVNIGTYISHLSVDQVEQTISLCGTMFAMWQDDFLVWNPDKYGNIKQTKFYQWEIWTPDIQFVNSKDFSAVTSFKTIIFLFGSVLGAAQTEEIRKNSAVVVTMDDSESTSSTVYLEYYFTTTIGCTFDFSNFPYDKQECPLVIVPTLRMNGIVLRSVAENMAFSLFGANNLQEKSIVSSWQVNRIWSDLQLYDGSSNQESSTISNFEFQADLTHVYELENEKLRVFLQQLNDLHIVFCNRSNYDWTAELKWLMLQRFQPYFGVTLILPAVVAFLICIFSTLLSSPSVAISVLLTNFLLISLFFEDLHSVLPPAIGGVPKIGSNSIYDSYKPNFLN
ncbi:unnamed protein product [Enterobius vermicularis]|uniref:Neur_chan_LBD domain-containing protein n=1 Tax=Enterobius vermicularis TaxID=51028 RepID=A0A0N4V1B6_ENTVE|nr:unnamed protein product [Enterobius vermicularis]